ncbi:MAG: hypothetical protein HOP24_01860, partial [Sideroxydans sp.]|nr:hypothetical protein [Sideroxydans sp.]
MNCRNAVKLSDPGAPNTQATSENFGILAKATTHEHGKALNFAGRYTDQIAYSNDGTLAFIASRIAGNVAVNSAVDAALQAGLIEAGRITQDPNSPQEIDILQV